MGNDIKRVPYGIASFKQVRSENKYLVDKTMYRRRTGTASKCCTSTSRVWAAMWKS